MTTCGAVYTNNDVLGHIMLSMRDWGRDCVCHSGVDDTCGHRFDGQYGQLPKGYDHKYVYSNFGYNMKMTDMQAAIGCAQLKKLAGFVQMRNKNWKMLREGINREKVVRYIEDKGVQTRMLFSGNLLRHPCFDEMREDGAGYRVVAQPPLMPIICAVPGGLVLVIFLLAMVMVRNNLKAEPIELLGGR